MRTHIFRRGPAAVLVTCALSSFVACEDGPNQTFSPAVSGAAGNWNDGKNPGKYDSDASNPFGQDFGGTSAVDTCVGDTKRARLAQAFQSDIVPPIKVAGVDLRGKGGEADYSGLLIDDTFGSDALCQGTTYFDPTDPQYGYTQWGDAQEVVARWDQTSRRIERLILSPGYTGKLEFDGPDVATPNDFSKLVKYRFFVNDMPKRSHDGGATWEDFPIKFDTTSQKVDSNYVQALANGMIQTFDPSQKQVDPTTGAPVDCAATGRCLLSPDSNTAGTLFGVRPVGMYLHFPNVQAPANIASKPDQAFVTFLKLLPFSSAPMFLKLDAEGPTAALNPIGDQSPLQHCNIHLLMSHKELLDSCIEVFQDSKANDVGLKKWLGGVAHDAEHFLFNVQAVDLRFASGTLAWNEVVQDGTKPVDGDHASAFQIDVRAGGSYLNDSVGTPGAYAKDFHGSSAVYWEYARLVQEDINKRLPASQRHDLGDPACLYPRDAQGNLPAGFDALAWRPAAGCTGFEGIVTLARANTGNPQYDKLRQFDSRSSIINGVNSNLGIGFRPGDVQALFCSDPTDVAATVKASRDPLVTDGCDTGTIWDTSYHRVAKFLGNGNVSSLPPEMQDRRYFFKEWGIALVKYMRVAANYGADYDGKAPIDLSAVDYDVNSLFFDDTGDGDAERVEYVERSFVAAGKPPIDFEYEASVKTGNQRYTHFFQGLDREESAMYQAMTKQADDKTLPGSGKQKLLLTDVFGSPVLQSVPGAADCAAGQTAKCPGDGEGNVIDLSPYPGALGASPFALGSKVLKVTKLRPDVRAAEIEIPNFADPYDAKSTQLAPITALVPWLPKGPGVGYAVPVTAQRDDFVPTAALDFSGITETFNLDIDYVDANGNVDGVEADGKNAIIKAVETSDFLGDVFLCRDPRSGDLLRTRMYSTINTVLAWIANHPGAQDACKIIVRYSPYNNYPDFVSSLTSGVKVAVNAGGGFGRVVDATLFIPQ
jgi:hypothetical protein